MVSTYMNTCIYFHIHTFFCDPPSICQPNMHTYFIPRFHGRVAPITHFHMVRVVEEDDLCRSDGFLLLYHYATY